MKRMMFGKVLAAILTLAITGIGLDATAFGQSAGQAPSVSDKIIQAGKIRVGFVGVSVGFNIDPKTGEKSGIFADVLREMAKNMGLQVEFAEEVTWGTMIAGLQTKRYDMIASPVWPNSSRVRQATFSNPVYYSGIGIWVRQNESRFSPAGGWASLNDPKIKIGAFDGSTGEKIAQTQFPNAKLVSYPATAGEGQLFLDVASGKVDAFFEEPAKGFLFVKNNPGKIKNIAAANPVKTFPNVFMLPAGDYRLKEMIDTALAEVENSGFVERTIQKYEPAPHSYYRAAVPYRTE